MFYFFRSVIILFLSIRKWNVTLSAVTELKQLSFIFRGNVTVAMDLHLLLKLLR